MPENNHRLTTGCSGRSATRPAAEPERYTTTDIATRRPLACIRMEWRATVLARATVSLRS